MKAIIAIVKKQYVLIHNLKLKISNMGKLQSLFGYLFEKENNVVSEKELIREKIRKKKQQLSDKDKEIEAANVFEKIEALPEFINAHNIMIYWSMPDELPTHDFIIRWSKKKTMLLPVVKGEDMLIKPFSTKEELKQGSLGIWEPDTQKEYLNSIDLVIVPGVAFDRNKSRLGRGKGYYDRYFINKRIVKIGVCFDFQLLESIPEDSFDIKMDKVITSSILIN